MTLRLFGRPRQAASNVRHEPLRPPAFWAAGLLVASKRCDRFTTLVTPTMKVAATAWQEWPDVVINM